jgi:DNA mismatch repair protein MLH3
MDKRASIDHLPPATRNKLRSTQILTSLPQIISELVQNSLDAGARQVDIGVDSEEWSCWVSDDGVGMSKEGMSVLGEGRYGVLRLQPY